MQITQEIVAKVLSVIDVGLSPGLGEPDKNGMGRPGKLCVEAAVCFALGLPHGDDPACVSRAVRTFKINLNDCKWSSKTARAKGLRRLAVVQLGTSDTIDDNEFAMRLAELAIRKSVPEALRSAASVKKNAEHRQKLLDAAKRCEAEGTRDGANAAAYVAANTNAAYAAASYAASAAAYAADYAAHVAACAACAANAAGAAADASLAGASLAGAKGIVRERCTPLLMLLDQPGKIRAYKLVDADLRSPIQSHNKLTYPIGQTISVVNASTDPNDHCAAGVNVATLDWCLKNWSEGRRILIVEFEAKDIACIPTATDGKIRLHRCDVIAERPLDLEALGLVKPQEKVAS